jgi:hypothetical protein
MDNFDERIIVLAKEIIRCSEIMSDAVRDGDKVIVDEMLIVARNTMAELRRVMKELSQPPTDEHPFH